MVGSQARHVNSPKAREALLLVFARAGTPFLQLLHRPATRPIETLNASLSLEITLQEKESQDAVLECAFRRPGSLSCNVILSEAFRKIFSVNFYSN